MSEDIPDKILVTWIGGPVVQSPPVFDTPRIDVRRPRATEVDQSLTDYRVELIHHIERSNTFLLCSQGDWCTVLVGPAAH